MINPRTGRVHTRYAQAAVITGRLASSDPSLQNIPVRTPEGRRVRAAFVASGGQIVSADYSQIELSVMAHVSDRSEEHTSELQSLMRISYAVFCLTKKSTQYHVQCTQ